ncbi:MAG TPA: 2Fe-2S iron-sulfur cluster-binding protein, partial [Polyangiales bacterium]
MSPSESAGTTASSVVGSDGQQSACEAACPRFVLDGQVIALEGVAPTRTLLEVLREDLGRTGTKEGCAEGDCGACTVVVGELDARGQLRHRAVNACIQLAATLDGRELLTVESLSRASDPLHPVQAALVECHASQCGFCTPGFAMTLFTLFKGSQRPSRRALEDALAGNLCRCTGYRPIVAAGERMFELAGLEPTHEACWLRCAPAVHGVDVAPHADLLARLVRTRGLELETPEGSFWAPLDLDAACARYVQHPAACVLAGGTDVGLWITKQGRVLPQILYLGNVRELQRCERHDDHLWIGA